MDGAGIGGGGGAAGIGAAGAAGAGVAAAAGAKKAVMRPPGGTTAFLFLFVIVAKLVMEET